MNKDIIRNILTYKENNDYIKRKNLVSKEAKFQQIIEIDKQTNRFKKNLMEKNKKKYYQNHNNYCKEQKKEYSLRDDNINRKIIKVMKQLNFINIIKSFFCVKDKNLKLINLCNILVDKDLCVERALKRLYILENEINLIKERNKNKSYRNLEMSRVKKLINRIDNELNQETKIKELIPLNGEKYVK